jgi:tetratricopeptide (TPR) repeat protein
MSENQLEHMDNLADKAGLLRENGRYAEAETLQRQIAEDSRRLRGLGDRATLLARGQLAHTLCCQGRYNEAAREQQDLMAIYKSSFGWDDNDTLGIVGHLVTTYVYQGKYDDARALAAQLLPHQDRFYGKDSLPSRSTERKLADIFHRQGRFSEAAHIQKRVLELCISSGNDLVTLAAAFSDYGSTLMAQGKFNDAQENLVQALKLSREAVGSDHSDTVNYQSTLAVLYSRQHNFYDATKTFRKVLSHREKSLGEAHGATIATMSDLASCLLLLGLKNDSKSQIDRAVRLAKEHLASRDPDRLSTLSNAASIYGALGQPNLELSFESFDLFRLTMGDDNPETLTAMMEYARALIRSNQLEVGREIMKLCILRTERKYGLNHQLTTGRAGVLAKVQEVQDERR